MTVHVYPRLHYIYTRPLLVLQSFYMHTLNIQTVKPGQVHLPSADSEDNI